MLLVAGLLASAGGVVDVWRPGGGGLCWGNGVGFLFIHYSDATYQIMAMSE